MEIDPNTHDRSMYRTMTGLVVPRPIGWISSQSADGDANLAPYSFFNVVSVDPPIVLFAPQNRADGPTDTAANILETEEFVVNIVTHEFAEQMNLTSASLAPSESEFDFANLGQTPSRRIEVPRVENVAASFECKLYDFQEVGSNSLVLGEVVLVHVRDELTTDGKVDTTKVDTVGRLAGSEYDKITNRFSMERPE